MIFMIKQSKHTLKNSIKASIIFLSLSLNLVHCQKEILTPLSYQRPRRPDVVEFLVEKVDDPKVTKADLTLHPEETLDAVEYIIRLELEGCFTE